jgi:curved DNA-binding protein CbpA
MKYFINCKSLEDLKAEYRRLVKLHHPDLGGDTETMKAINDEHDRVFEILKKQHNASADEYHQTTETAEEFRTLINELLKLSGIIVELCGNWVWLSGNPKEHKEALKALGCRWSQNKKMWYWRHPEEGRKHYKGHKDMNSIRAKYGSQVFHGATESTNYTRVGAAS